MFDRIVVSTDDDAVARAAEEAGAEVPFRRTPALSDDHTPLVPVIADTVQRLGVAADDLVCCVYPTAIGLSPTDLTSAGLLLGEQAAHPYVVGVVAYPHPIQRALSRDESGSLAMVHPEYASTRTQDLDERWHDAGQFVWGRAEAWTSGLSVLPHSIGYVLPAWRSIDLDTEEDWVRAELIHRLLLPGALG